MTQQICWHTEADDARQAKGQSEPADGVDRFSEQHPGQERHQQGLGINQYRTEPCAGFRQPTGQQPLEQAGIHKGEQKEPGKVTTIQRPATATDHGPGHQHKTSRQQTEGRNKPGTATDNQRRHRRHGCSPQREGKHHQQPETERCHGKGGGCSF